MKRFRIVFVLLLMVLIVTNSAPSSAIVITNLTQLVNANGCGPTWSPDGKKVAFGDGIDIWMIDIDDTNLVPLTENLSSIDWTATWSPDGKKVAFMSSRSGNLDIWSMDTDGTNLTQLTTDPSDEGFPKWSPDGKKIAFFSSRSGNWDIWVLNVQNGELTQLTTHPKNDVHAAWSPDGKKIAFASFRGAKIDTDIWVIDVDGTNLIQLTTDPKNDDYPTWSPDGNMIAFRSERSGNSDIWVMNADGTNQTQLTTDPEVDECCAWGPDGKIAFGSKRSDGVNVWIAEISLEEKRTKPPLPANISISSNPSRVDLYVDGTHEGRTPKTIQVQPGKHQIRLRRSGFNDEVIDVEVFSGDNENISVSLSQISRSPRIGRFLVIGVMIVTVGLIAVVLYFRIKKKR